VYPTLFEFSLPYLGTVQIPSHLTLILLGFSAAIIYLQRQSRDTEISETFMMDFALLVFVVGIIGARTFSIFTDGLFYDFVHLCTDPRVLTPPGTEHILCKSDLQCLGGQYLCDLATEHCYPPRDCLKALKFWEGGLTYYGGFLAATPAGIWFIRRKKIDVWHMADLSAPAIMLGLFFGRIGCFLSGCCWGVPTESFLGVDHPFETISVHPTQLYSAFAVLAIFFVLRHLSKVGFFHRGQLFAIFLVLYAISRFFLEFFRNDPRGAWGPLATSQLISIPLLCLGIWIYRHRKNKK